MFVDATIVLIEGSLAFSIFMQVLVSKHSSRETKRSVTFNMKRAANIRSSYVSQESQIEF